MKVIILDNFDSFTHNLMHYVEPHVERVDVFRNDSLDLDIVEEYDKVILSPGPGLPKEAGILPDFLHRFWDEKPILGVCLGLQAIVEHAGGKLRNLPSVLHGVSSQTSIAIANPLMKNLPSTFPTGHYHSWVAEEEMLPSSLEVLATNEDGFIMAVRHKERPIYGVQFHPESIMTPHGKGIIENWIKHC
ncbi:MAG: aminodeoxychorismate/anthranilate synthase component II [Bacteroidota bacterium]